MVFTLFHHIRIFCILLLHIVISTMCNAQSRVVIDNNAFIVIDNNTFFVVDNPSNSAIATSGTGGNIISEGEFNVLKWNILNNSGTYIVPFTKSPGIKIPLALNITSAGLGSGSLLLSTYTGANWDNSSYVPLGVTNMLNASLVDHSSDAIDRYWNIDAINFTTKPTTEITFTYVDNEWSAVGNTISESALLAERFNPAPASTWYDWYGTAGTANTVSNTVQTGPVSSANFFKSWTLTDDIILLPISLLYFKANCTNKNELHFNWASINEHNYEYYIEGSEDGKSWLQLTHDHYSTSINGNNNEYEQVIQIKPTLTYFRLAQKNKINDVNYSEIIYRNCYNTVSPNISLSPNPTQNQFDLLLSNFENQKLEISIRDVSGRLIKQRLTEVVTLNQKETFFMAEEAKGVYFVSIKTNTSLFNEKIIIY